ncbi:hypothetical protein [Sporomusa termitida]|uniref:hypothetical protein n=1 Tax=Sporomusa termitida TaxID=2377 RepID=UPI001186D399|nr:hypothetical protein [Sporomusa termitida]
MIIGQDIQQEGNKIILTNHIDDTLLRQQNYEEKKLVGRGFTPDKKLRKFGSVTPALIQADPLLREGLQAELNGDASWADRCYRLFFRLNPEYRCSEGGI